MHIDLLTVCALLLCATAGAQAPAAVRRPVGTQDPTVERGDPGQGGKLARSVAGRYRSSEENGDVSGRQYRTTDTLSLTPVGPSSIHFDVTLHFFNGHTCGLSGGALYRKDGSFVFDDVAENKLPDEPLCRLAIVPDARGVNFRDLTGGCKISYCGERGSWNGNGFSFRQRVRTGTPARR